MMRLVIADSLYPAVARDTYAANPELAHASVAEQQAALLAHRFGTWDSFEDSFRRLGHEAHTHLLGVPQLDAARQREGNLIERGFTWTAIIVQDVGRFSVEQTRALRERCRVLVGICNHHVEGPHLQEYTFLTSAFPHQVRRLRSQGLDCRLLGCAFDVRHLYGDPVMEPLDDDDLLDPSPKPERDIAISFVGSVGNPEIWGSGNHALSALAERFPLQFKWWGENLLPQKRQYEHLHASYQGPAYGQRYMEILGRSRISINRQGSTSRGWTTNMRNYEITGMGALLCTEASHNLHDLWRPWEEVVPYLNPDNLCNLVEHYLQYPERVEALAARGQERTLWEHCYHHRADTLEQWLLEAA